jgi:hypothetical protein
VLADAGAKCADWSLAAALFDQASLEGIRYKENVEMKRSARARGELDRVTIEFPHG